MWTVQHIRTHTRVPMLLLCSSMYSLKAPSMLYSYISICCASLSMRSICAYFARSLAMQIEELFLINATLSILNSLQRDSHIAKELYRPTPDTCVFAM